MLKLKWTTVFLVLSVFMGVCAWAGSFEDSQANMAKAYNDFYKAMASSPNGAQDAKALSSQILAPASRGVVQAANQTAAETMKKIVATPHAKPRSIPLPPGTDLKKSPWFDKNAANHPSAQGAPQNAPAPTQPKTVLDGSQIPREIDFSGPNKPDSQ